MFVYRHQLGGDPRWRGSVAGTSSLTLTFRWEMWRLGSTSYNVRTQHFLWKIWRYLNQYHHMIFILLGLPTNSSWQKYKTTANIGSRPGWSRSHRDLQTLELLRPGEVTSGVMQQGCYQHYQHRILYTLHLHHSTDWSWKRSSSTHHPQPHTSNRVAESQ